MPDPKPFVCVMCGNTTSPFDRLSRFCTGCVGDIQDQKVRSIIQKIKRKWEEKTRAGDLYRHRTQWLALLMEEVGEVARTINDRDSFTSAGREEFENRFTAELIDVIVICLGALVSRETRREMTSLVWEREQEKRQQCP